ncbi:hypothetical protein GEV33_000253 [Tenebrio molitor]|uniref:Uncharacterized protein n=1 Tax=Tenebrio molitor TaxID=7067 RepID=A0A8J6HYU0_TENMO|nr:hypothetical protein GEV33_000253 [Tenebrio molitor]
MSNVAEKLDDSKIDTAYRFYEILMKERCVEPDVEVVTDESLLEGFTAEVSHLLTREDIKKQSAEIVAANNKDEDMSQSVMVGQSVIDIDVYGVVVPR